MFSRVNLTSVLIVILCSVTVNSAKKMKTRHGPGGMSFDDTTNCTEFSKYGRFNPYSVLREKWFVFFYWDAPKPLTTYIFTFPTANHTKHLKKILEGNTILPVMWSARHILMEDQKNEISLLVERSDRGEYWRYPLYKVTGLQKITPRDVRLKQTGDNRLIGFMDCVDETMFVMARINDVPPKNRLVEEASRLGFRGRRGKSYLYQGHEWVPIPEDDESKYWHYPKKDKEQEESSNEVQGSSEEESAQTNKQKETEQEEDRDNDNKLLSEKNVEPNCIKIEPELWNDPKPDPTKFENKMMSIEDLNKVDANETIDIDNTSLNESYNSTSNKRETILETDVKNIENIQKSTTSSTVDQPQGTIDVKVKTVGEIEEDKKGEENKTDVKNLIDKKPRNTKAELESTDFKIIKEQKTEEKKVKDERTKENKSDKNKAEAKKVDKVEGDEKGDNEKAEDKKVYHEKTEDKKAKISKSESKKAKDGHATENKVKLKKLKEKKVNQEAENEEYCDVCYDSSTSIYSTSEAYTPKGAPYKKTERGIERNFESGNTKGSTKNEDTTKKSTEEASNIQNLKEDIITMTMNKLQV